MDGGLKRVGIYMRLSRDDDKASASIEHQRLILREYVEEQGGTIADEYADDGWSGTNFERPEVKRLLKDVREGKLDTVLVKDLSRFGRNYIQVGQFIDYFFPALGVRFIALNDRIDTADPNASAMDMMPIMNVFNEWHAANTSKKIRAVLDASRRSGKFTSWSYPYGYKAGDDPLRTAVVDERAAEVVRRIFDLRLKGNSARAIAKALNDEGIENPATYFRKLNGARSSRRCAPYWSPKTVLWILKNPTYLGKTVQHRTTRISYKNHAIVRIPEEEWIVREHAHEPIVEEDVWRRAQTVAQSGGRADKRGSIHPLSGLLVCRACGKKLKRKSAGESGRYLCRTYVDAGKRFCTAHSISERAMEFIILSELRVMASLQRVDEADALARFQRKNEKKNNAERCVRQDRERLAELESIIRTAFEERALNNLSEEMFERLIKDCEKERAAIEKKLCAKENARPASKTERFLSAWREFFRFERLSREMCLQLIDHILVGEEEGALQILIVYKFADPFPCDT